MLDKSYKIVYGFRNSNAKYLEDCLNICVTSLCEGTNYPREGVRRDLLNKLDHDWSVICLDGNKVAGVILFKIENVNDIILTIQNDSGEIETLNENLLSKYNTMKGIHGIAFAVDKSYRKSTVAFLMTRKLQRSRKMKQNFDYITASQSEYFDKNINYRHKNSELLAVLNIFQQNISLFVKKIHSKF